MLYRWPEGAIRQLETTRLAQSSKVNAVVRLSEDISDQDIKHLRRVLSEGNFINFLESTEGIKTIILPELDDSKPLINLLSSGGFSKGLPQVMESPADRQFHKDRKSIFKRQPLLTAALFYNLGDVTEIISGIQRARHNHSGRFTRADLSEMMFGVTLALSDVLLAFYGKEEPMHPMLSFSDALSQYLKSRGVELPLGDKLTSDTVRRSGFFYAVNDFLHRNIISIKAASRITAGALEVNAAFKKGNFNPGKLAGGMLLATGWLVTFFLDHPHAPPFKFKSEDNTAADFTGKELFHWIAENPRGRVAAPFAMGENIFKGLGAINEATRYRKQVNAAREMTGPGAAEELRYAERKQYDFVWNMIHTCTALTANYFLGKSGKKHVQGSDDTDQTMRDMLTVAANVLMNVPEEVRNFSIQETAQYMANIQGIYNNNEEIAALITEKIAELHMQDGQANIHQPLIR